MSNQPLLKSNIRCENCKLFCCKHIRNSSIKSTTSTIPMSATPMAQNQRVLIPPPPPLPTIETPITSSILSSTKDQWINCNVCQARVYSRYLTEHVKIHALTYKPKARVGILPVSTTTKPYTIPHTHNSTSSAITHVPSQSENKPTTSYQRPRLQPVERFQYRDISNAAISASTNKTNRYSDITLVLWGDETVSATSTSYAGGTTSYVSKDWERFQIHITYDSREDYYTIQSKLLKRSQYSTYDTEDTSVPDRICEQSELAKEIKRSLLFFKISPRNVYKLVRKLFNDKFDIEYKDGKAFLSQTSNCKALTEKLSKSSTHSSWTNHDHGYV